MLVITRTTGQKTTITTPSGETIIVCIVGVNGPYVRLGFDAKREIQIRRDDAGKGPKQCEP